MIKSEQKEQILKDYLAGVPIKDICNIYSVCRATVRNIAKRAGAESRITYINEENEAEIKMLYEAGESILNITKSTGFNKNLVSKVLKEFGCVIRLPASYKQQVKENPFKDLTKDIVQYWLGYLASDGNISKNSNSIRLTTNLDNEHLKQNYVKFLGGSATVIDVDELRYIKKSVNTTIYFSSKEVKEYLINLGITPVKSKTLNILFPLTFGFLRGILDGDGCVHLKEGKYVQVSFYTASYNFANQISKFLTSENIYNKIRFNKSNNIFGVEVTKREFVNILYKKLYENAEAYLNRKKLKFLAKLDKDIA